MIAIKKQLKQTIIFQHNLKENNKNTSIEISYLIKNNKTKQTFRFDYNCNKQTFFAFFYSHLFSLSCL